MDTKFWLENLKGEEGHIKTDLEGKGCGLDLVGSGQEMVVSFIKGGNFLTSKMTISFSRRILYHVVS
jgi:hypothetical protein